MEKDVIVKPKTKVIKVSEQAYRMLEAMQYSYGWYPPKHTIAQIVDHIFEEWVENKQEFRK